MIQSEYTEVTSWKKRKKPKENNMRKYLYRKKKNERDIHSGQRTYSVEWAPAGAGY
jgi:hypothetical protein